MGSVPTKYTAGVMLTLSSLHCHWRVNRGCKHARAAYRLYIITGVAFILREAIFSESEYFITLTNIFFAWSYVLGLPLLATDICKYSGSIPDFAALHLIIPMSSLTMFHVEPEFIDPYLLAVSHAFSIFAIVICGAFSGNSASFAFTLSHYFAMFSTVVQQGLGLIKYDLTLDPVQDSRIAPNFMETWQFVMALSNLFSAYLLPR